MSKECKNCGQSLNDDDKYCPTCGTPVYAKRLYRSKTDSRILGVCGGLGEYFKIDSNLIRVIAALIILATGVVPGLIIYFIAGLIIPEKE
ncbi:MAG: PspC domain-containing protein [Candidatus Marinimicrobia bacterium]|nr:PspC domain-containing protein [Candidatus Neomarinimicrobiota bacterium]